MTGPLPSAPDGPSPLPPALAAIAAQLHAIRTMVDATLAQLHALAMTARPPRERAPAGPQMPPVLGGPPTPSTPERTDGTDDLTARIADHAGPPR